MNIKALAKHVELRVPNLKFTFSEREAISFGISAWDLITSNAMYSNKNIYDNLTKHNLPCDLITLHVDNSRIYEFFFHELAHAMGSRERLNRFTMAGKETIKNMDHLKDFSKQYNNVEEYIAESCADKLLNYYNLHNADTIEGCRDYIFRNSPTLVDRKTEQEIDRCVKAIVEIIGDVSQIRNAA